MKRYFFDLKDGGPGYLDLIGEEFPGDDTAIAHARRVGAELSKYRERSVAHWRIDVRNDDGEQIFSRALSAQDRTIDQLNHRYRVLVSNLARRCGSPKEAIAQAHALTIRLRES